MSEQTLAFIINESKGPEVEPKNISRPSKNICRFNVDVLQEADTINRNKRRYKWDVLYEACQHPYVKERLDTGTFYCESGHPVEQTIERQLRIDRTNVSCIIKELDYKKPYILGPVVETAATSIGKDLMGLILENGCKIAFSMRGIGNVKETNGVVEVGRPLRIVCWDEVVHPSVTSAYMGSVINGGAVRESGDSMILLQEEELAKYALEASPSARKVLDSLEINPMVDGSSISINEDGTISLRQQGSLVVCLTEGYIRRELSKHLARIRSGRR